MTPNDTIVGPIVAGLIAVGKQIDGIGRFYPEPPEGAPEDNSVIFPPKGFKVEGDTNGRMQLRITFEINHVFRRGRLNETYSRIIPFLPAWLDRLSAWPNQDLGGAAQSVDVEGGRIDRFMWGSQEFLALTLTVSVLTEFAISTS